MSFFFRLSKYISIPILKEWCGFVDYGRLDTSATNDRERKILHEYSRFLRDLIVPKTLEIHLYALHWISARGFDLWDVKAVVTHLIKPFSLIDSTILSSVLTLEVEKINSLMNENLDLPLDSPLFIFTSLRQLKICVSNNCLIKITANNPYLELLDLSDATSIVDDTMLSVFQSCQRLSGVFVSRNYMLTDQFLTNIVEYSKNVKNLDIGDCHKITKEGLLYFIKNHSTKMVSFSYHDMNDATLLAFMEHLGGDQLEHLDISHSVMLTNKSVFSISYYCPNLTHLNVLDISNADTEFILLDDVLKGLPKLKSVNFMLNSCVSNETIKTLVNHCNGIQELYLGHNHAINSDGFQQIQKLANLTILSFIDISLRNDDLVVIMTACIKVIELTIGKTAVRDDAFSKQYAHLYAKLVKFHCGTSMLSDSAFAQIAFHCPNLTDVKCASSPNLLGYGITDLMRKCKKLTSLDISRTRLTAQVVYSIREDSRLKYLYVKGCERISTDSLYELIKRVPRLTYLATDRVSELRDLLDVNRDIVLM